MSHVNPKQPSRGETRSFRARSLCTGRRRLEGKLTFIRYTTQYRGIWKGRNGKRDGARNKLEIERWNRGARRRTLWYSLDGDISLALLGIYRLTWKLNGTKPYTCATHYTSFPRERLTFRNRESLCLRFTRRFIVASFRQTHLVVVIFWFGLERGGALGTFIYYFLDWSIVQGTVFFACTKGDGIRVTKGELWILIWCRVEVDQWNLLYTLFYFFLIFCLSAFVLFSHLSQAFFFFRGNVGYCVLYLRI